ncbi:hypothetical protein KKI24_23755 [bacterium]|nr:hypothetical protein [bacterium]
MRHNLLAYIGIVLRFQTRKERKVFAGFFKDIFGEMSSLNNTSPLLRAAKANGLIINVSDDSPFLPIQLAYAFENYTDLDPAANFLALVCRSDWSCPRLFSFLSKSSRDFFINEIKGIKLSPLFVFSVPNFHPIAIIESMKGPVSKYSIKESLAFISTHFFNDSQFQYSNP